jgi:uncharacterized protein (UPF0335 family)
MEQMSLVTKEDDDRNNIVGGVDCNRLLSIIERVEKLEEDRKCISDDIRDVFAEAKAWGFDVKTMKAIIKLRKMDSDTRNEQEFLIEEYKKLCGL